MCSSKLVRATIQAAWAETPSVRGLRLVLVRALGVDAGPLHQPTVHCCRHTRHHAPNTQHTH
jgi:hypothetical protein